jgi:hypothetical protein
MGRAKTSNLRKILTSDAEQVLVSPEGKVAIYKVKWPDLPIIHKLKNKNIYYDLADVHKYVHNAEVGVIVPHDKAIAGALIRHELTTRENYEVNVYHKYGNWLKQQHIEKDENKHIKHVSDQFRQMGGGQIIADGRQSPSIGNSFADLGGIKYTFGIELETSAGRLTLDDLYYANTSMQGDRTIKAYEYVTNILSGDVGLKNLKALANAIRKRTLIGDGNGLHIHIGGHTNKKLWTPRFNRMFSINAIKLGVQIEDEMMALLHPERRTDRYLQSIKDWGNIDGSNWREVLGDFVFRGSENPFKEYANYQTHSLDEMYNSEFPISRWAKTKHKWMNLNHCNADSHVHTIEFRLFSSTGDYKKIYNFLLLSLAIVWFIESRQRLIWDGAVTLETIVDETFGKRGYNDIAIGLYRFINNRKLKFNIGNNEKIKVKN